MYTYEAIVTKVETGDTIIMDIELGFGIVMKEQKIRIMNVNAPGIKGASGMLSRNALRDLTLGKNIVVKTYKDKKGKYNRWIGEIFIDGINVSEWLVENGWAESETW